MRKTRYLWVPGLIVPAVLLFETPHPAGRERQEQAASIPERELFTEHVSGLLVRSTYQADASGTITVTIWDLLVGPGKRSEPAALPGAAVLTIRSGDGLLLVDGEQQNAVMGKSIVVAEGAQVSFDNRRGDQSIAARAILISRP